MAILQAFLRAVTRSAFVVAALLDPAALGLLPPVAGPVLADESNRPAQATRPPPAAARALFREECAKCHGRDGRGAAGREKFPEIPDFSRGSWQGRRRDPELVRSILEGKEVAMPAFKGKLDEKQVRELVAYIRTFGPEQPKRGKPSADRFQERFRELEEELNKLRQEAKKPAESRPRAAPRAPAPAAKEAPAAEEGPAPRKAGRASAGLFRQHCVKCHGADGAGSAKRARWPHIPDFTDASWQRRRSEAQLLAGILDGKGADMPPRRGKLSEDQARGLVASVRAFAPATDSPGQERQDESLPAEATGQAEPPSGFSEKLTAWLGRFHPPAVHFPIALLTAAALAELLRLVTGKPAFEPVARYGVWLGFLTALPAGALGWCAGGFHLTDASCLLMTHRWLGSSTVACAGLALALGEVSRRSTRFRIWFRVTLFGAAGVALATGFFGGALVFGLDHYAWPP
jgi:mono/diheme cytochrome c family protein/uncharacterized membrane protein